MSKTRQTELMQELDTAALALLKRHFKQAEGAADPDAVEQIKAFAAVVNYYGPRTKLGGDEDAGKSEFEGLRGRLHGRRTPRRRAGNATPAANGSGVPHDAADPGDPT